jgi:hypothetical protein
MAEGPVAESAVVILEVRFVQGSSEPSLGTGSIVDNNGLIVTAGGAAHVQESHEYRTSMLNGPRFLFAIS